MTVIHHSFGSSAKIPDATPQRMLPLSAADVAEAAKHWIDEALAAFHEMTPEQRKEAAAEAVAQARDSLSDDTNHRVWMTVIGRHAWMARIMMAED